MKALQKKIEEHGKRGENVLVFAYLAGHGVSDTQQHFLINTDVTKDVLFHIEERLRILTKYSRDRCFVLAVYDICRLKADKMKDTLARYEKEM